MCYDIFRKIFSKDISPELPRQRLRRLGGLEDLSSLLSPKALFQEAP